MHDGRDVGAGRGAWAIAGLGIVALILRLAPYAVPGVILTTREYDDGVMFSAAITLLRGELPYSDFVYLHPPGSILWLVPAASLSDSVGEPVALAVARLVAVAVGVANTVVIGILLRRRGVVSIVVGAGLYAVWPVVITTERTVMLEPVLNLGLLLALLCIATRRISRVWLAGAALGLALTVKYWAVVDLLVVACMVAALMGARALLRFAVSAASAVAVIMLPFFVVDPGAMWHQSVVSQLSRPPTATPLVDRASIMSLTQNIHALDAIVPGYLWAALVVGLLVLAAVPVILAVVRRRPLRGWDDAAWWGIVALAHAAVLTLSGLYFYHYATWLLAPLALSTGAAVHYLHSTTARGLAAATMVLVVVVLAVGESRRLTPAVGDPERLAEWSSTHECVWGMPSRLIEADAVRRNLDNGCAFDVDPLGVSIVLSSRSGDESTGLTDSALWQQRAMSQLARSEAALLGGWGTPEWMPAAQEEEFERAFERDRSLPDPDAWVRSPVER